ncbi:response regulator [Pseudanabaena biceps]|nr:response regulator [Pseudanabaena biceps]
MQDKLSNPYKSLQVIARKELTGCLSISIPQDNSIVWQLYIGGSRLYYATTNHYSRDRFNLIWQQIAQDRPLPKFSPDKSEYESLYEWHLEHNVSLTDFRRILLNMSREALIQSVAYVDAYVKFEPETCIKPVLIAAPLPDLIQPMASHVRFWQKLHANIPSPFTRLYLDPSKVKDLITFLENSPNPSSEKSLVQNVSLPVWLEILEQKLSIYEICHRLSIETHTLSLWLHPLIENKVLEVLPSIVNSAIAVPSLPTGALIACIDDSHTVQRQVKIVLEMSGFQVLGITDPASCLSLLVRQKPALILMDITMPEIDGYELCKMLRQSRHLRKVPIVMFTGREGLIDRMRAQLVGASDYITKPVNADKLVTKVQRLLQNNQNELNVGIGSG